MKIGDWLVDPQTNEIKKQDEVRRISPLAMDILLHLAAESGEVVDSNTLIDANWPGDKGSDNALYKIMAELRRAFDDTNRRDRIFQTVAKRGYKLTLPVSEDSEQTKVARAADPLVTLKRSMADGEARILDRDYTLAIQHFEIALQLSQSLKLPDHQIECDANLKIGQCVLLEQGRELAHLYYDRAREVALSIQDHVRHARALLGLSGNLLPLLDQQAEDLRQQLQLAFYSLPKSELALGNLLRSRIISFSRPVTDELVQESEQVVEQARALDDPYVLAHALLAQHELKRLRCETKRQSEISAEYRELMVDGDDRDLISSGYLRSISDALQLGDQPKALVLLEEFKLLEPRFVFQDDINRIEANFAMMAGRLDEAERFAMSISAREPGYRLQQFLQLVMIRRFQGRSQELVPMVENLAATYAHVDAVRAYLALLYHDCGEHSALKRTLDSLPRNMAAYARDLSWIPAMTALVELAFLGRDEALAQALLPEVEAFSKSHISQPSSCYFGSGAYFMGLLYAVMGKQEAMDKFFKQAQEMHVAAGAVMMHQKLERLLSNQSIEKTL